MRETAESEDGTASLSRDNQREKISFRTDEVRKFFFKNYSPAQMQDVMLRCWKGISVSGNGRRKDEARQIIDLNEVIKYEGNGKGSHVRVAEAADE